MRVRRRVGVAAAADEVELLVLLEHVQDHLRFGNATLISEDLGQRLIWTRDGSGERLKL
jgi:hypothetical protein